MGKREDEMAVDAVCSELLSAINFPLTGKSTGNFLDFGLVASAGIPLSPCIQDIYCGVILNPAYKEQGTKKWVSGNCIP
jgi:hypothetical protein